MCRSRRVVRKKFGDDWFEGIIATVHPAKKEKYPYLVKYIDGDMEDLSYDDVSKLLLSGGEAAKALTKLQRAGIA